MEGLLYTGTLGRETVIRYFDEYRQTAHKNSATGNADHFLSWLWAHGFAITPVEDMPDWSEWIDEENHDEAPAKEIHEAENQKG